MISKRILTTLFAVSCAALPSAADTIGFWPLDDPDTPGTIVDVTGNSPNGTPIGSPLYLQPGVPPGTYGPIMVEESSGAAIGFTAPVEPAPNYFVMGNNHLTPLQSIPRDGAFTVMSWVKLNEGVPEETRVVFSTGTSTGAGGWKLGVSPTRIQFTTYGVADNYSPTVTITPGQWYHIAATYNDGAISYYLNGTAAGTSNSWFNPVPATARLTIGHRIGHLSPVRDQLDGTLDGIRMYSRELDAEEIRQAAVDSLATTVENDPLLVLPGTLNFTNNGAQETYTIPFSNEGGTRTLTLSAVTLEGGDAGYFSVDDFTGSVAPGESGTIDVTFDPIFNGSYQVTVLIASNDAFAAVKPVVVNVEVSDPLIAISLDRVDFGELEANPGQRTIELTVTNEGGVTPLDLYTVSLLGEGGSGFSVVSFPESIEPGENGVIVIAFDPGSSGGDFGDLLRIETNAVNTANFLLPVLAKVAFSPGATPVAVVNGDFEAGGWNSSGGTSPAGWTNSRAATNSGGFYGQGGGTGTGQTPGLTSIAAHLQSYAGYYEQNLSANNPGLSAGGLEGVTVAFDSVYRNDAATNGHALLRVSLWDATNDVEIAGQNLLFEDPGVQTGNDLTPVTVRLGYDASGYEGEEVAVRITRIPPLLSSSFQFATLVVDNVSVSADGDWEPSDAYAVWALAAGLDGSVGKESGPADDPDRDGVLNFEEFAFGGDPLSGESGALAAAATADSSGDSLPELILTVAVRAEANFSGSPSPTASANGVNYTIEGGFDLVDFGAEVEGPLAVSVVPASLPAVPPAGYKYVSFRLEESNGLPGKGFLRAKAEAP